MFLTKKHLSRRTVLKGAGARIALPLLDAMIPAGTALADTAASDQAAPGFVYFPHGAVQKFWTPEGTGKDFKFSPILKPLEGMRDYVTVVTGLRNKPGESSDPHGIIEATWLTCRRPTAPRAGPECGRLHRPGGRAPDRPGHAAALASSCAASPAARCQLPQSPASGLPLEGNPRKVFTTMFGPGDSNAERKGLLQPPAACSTTCRKPARASTASWMRPTGRWSATTWTRCARSRGACRS